jgi:hypothetical protein
MGMATWAKCSDHNGQTLRINLDNVTTMTRRDTREETTEIIFVGGALVTVRERPEDLINPLAPTISS